MLFFTKTVSLENRENVQSVPPPYSQNQADTTQHIQFTYASTPMKPIEPSKNASSAATKVQQPFDANELTAPPSYNGKLIQPNEQEYKRFYLCFYNFLSEL